MNPTKEIHTHTLPDINLKLPIFNRLYEFYQILTQTTTGFPKSRRYTLGSKLDNLTLEMIEILLQIPYSENRLKLLHQISIKLDLLKILVRLSKDCSAITDKKYFQLELKLTEIGKMLGGWMRVYNRKVDG